MHAQATAQPIRVSATSCLQRADTIKPGQLFMRAASLNEVLATLSYSGSRSTDSAGKVWAVVINTSAHSAGFVAGQLIDLRADDLVRTVRESASAQYALEH